MSRVMIRNAITGAFGASRFVQNSPILPDVWLRYFDVGDPSAPSDQAQLQPIDRRVDLLLSSTAGSEPGVIAKTLREGLAAFGVGPAETKIAHNRTSVAVRLTFSELIYFVVPITRWWNDLPPDLKDFSRQRLSLQGGDTKFKSGVEVDFFTFAATAGLLGILLRGVRADATQLCDALTNAKSLGPEVKPLLEEYQALARNFEYSAAPEKGAVGRVQLNREGQLSVFESRRTIKADACYNLFHSSAANIKWAIVDCGIDAKHSAFGCTPVDAADVFTSRVVATYDFSRIRDLLSGAWQGTAAGTPLTPDQQAAINTLIQQRADGRQIDWSAVRPLITVPHDASYALPPADHGTHVAGIVGADWAADPNGKPIQGVCPDIKLVDIRVFDATTTNEFNVVSALQFIGYLNRLSDVPEIHGANLSFSFAHDVRNFACGRTPICIECERLVDNGVVVVAAAGNSGYTQLSSDPSLADRYATMTITDPGNAASVITVGSTHRTQPHTYGVSYFSSRGPTGDGRAKPDLLAPGEKILSTVPFDQSGEKDGTSMAAPHVSGAAAIVMSRNPELIGQPRRIKDLLCRTATDLGREKSFQGAGLVDILRALQSV